MVQCVRCSTPLQAEAGFCPNCGLAVDAHARAPEEPVSQTVDGLETLDGIPTGHKTNRPHQDLVPGSEFAERYTIEAVIGRGGMGVVYRAADKLTNQTVALKLIRPERAAGDAAIKKLIAEGTNSRNIRHKNVIAVYDVGEVDGQPFISMEYLDHGSLRAWHRQQALNRETVPMRVAARIIIELLDGLKAAHDVGIIHRDLKPENIILIGEPTETSAPLKILDFGIANIAGASEPSTGAGLGTVGYMAPEQITNPAAATQSADLYSLSVIFYELLMDVQPVGHWQPPSGARSDVPQEIDKLIEEGLSNRPASRPQSALEYHKRLTGPPPPPPIPPLKQNNNMLKWIGGGVAVFLVLGIITMMGEGGTGYEAGSNTGVSSTSPAQPSSNPYADISGRWYFCDGQSVSVEVSRNGRFSYNWVGVTVRGTFQGSGGQYEMAVDGQGVPFVGQMQIIDTGHIGFEIYSRNDQILRDAGRIHINHRPGPGDCP